MSKRARIALAILFLVALALDFLFYTGFFASDDLQYLTGARKIAALLRLRLPGEGAPGMGNARLGMTVPAGVVWWISGGSVAAVAWFHVVYHLALVGLAFALGKLFGGRERHGLIAAAIAATSPILYVFAGAILPDNATAVWLAIILILLELVRRREEAGPLATRAALRWYLAIGALFGVAYSCKDTAIIMTVPAAACVMASAPSLKSWTWVKNGAFMIAGLALYLVVEAFALRLVLGEWVFRPAMVEGIGDILVQRMEIQGGANPFTRFWFAVGDRMAQLAPVTTFALLAGAVGYAFTRGRRLSLLLFFWWPFVYMTVGTTSLSAYLPPSIQTRYYAIVILPAAVMTAVWLLALWERWRAWALAPRVLRGAPAVAAVVVIALGVVWFELEEDLPQSGNIYKAPYVRGLAAAYQVARDDHPQYPIVIGSTYGGRMRTLLAPDGGERLHFAGAASGLPEPPYLYVGLAGDGAPGGEGLAVQPIETVRPARSRYHAVANQAGRLFGLPPFEPPEPHPLVIGTVEVVARADAAPPAGRATPGPWVVMDGAPRVRALADGHMIEWDGRAEMTLQLNERGGFNNPPRDPRARLTAPAARLAIAVPMRLLAGKQVRVGVNGFGYGAAGDMTVRQAAAVTLVAGAAPTAVAIELAGATPMDRVRVRIRVRATRGGSLFVGHPVIDGEAR